MKAAGLFLLCAGLAIVLSALLLLLPAGASRVGFVMAGIVVQLGGLIIAFRAHYTLDEEP